MRSCIHQSFHSRIEHIVRNHVTIYSFVSLPYSHTRLCMKAISPHVQPGPDAASVRVPTLGLPVFANCTIKHVQFLPFETEPNTLYFMSQTNSLPVSATPRSKIIELRKRCTTAPQFVNLRVQRGKTAELETSSPTHFTTKPWTRLIMFTLGVGSRFVQINEVRLASGLDWEGSHTSSCRVAPFKKISLTPP